MRRWNIRKLRRAVHQLDIDQRGFSLVEAMMALTILAVGFLALATAASTGARALLQGKQRQAASEVASRQIEHLRNVPFDDVALSESLTKSGDPAHPDAAVSADGTGYDHDGDGSHEPLVVQAGGQVTHVEPFTVGTTQLTAYHYVTWVDDPAITGTQDYKRVTIVAYYDNPAGGGRPRTVTVSTLLTDGSITIAGTEQGASEGSGSGASPTPIPSSSPGSCSGTDLIPPVGEFSIASGTGAAVGYTASTTATVLLSITDTCTPITVQLSNDALNFSAAIPYDPNNPTVTWTLAPGDGTKNIWARYIDGNGNLVLDGPETIELDTTSPTTAGVLNRTILCVGTDRTVTLAWSPSIDTNLVGYRAYRSVDNGPWTILERTALLTAADTHVKTLDSVRYRVVGYDKAGNESAPTNTVALSKNQCS